MAKLTASTTFQVGAVFLGAVHWASQEIRASLRPIDPKGESLWAMGDRVRLETAVPPVLGKETWADVGVPSHHSHLLLSDGAQ